MSDSLVLYPLGVGDSGTQEQWHTSFALWVGQQPWIIDCPRSLHAMLASTQHQGERPVSLRDYERVILTHLHFDHAEGLVELANGDARHGQPPIALYAPASLLDYFWSDQTAWGVMSAAQVVGGAATLDRCFRPIPLANPHDCGSFRLWYRATQHIPNTFAYRFDFGSYQIGYSADTAFDPELIDWLSPCDLILHEVLLPPWTEVDAVRRIHTPLADLLRLPLSFQRKTLLCHYSDAYREYPAIGAYRYLQQHRVYELCSEHSDVHTEKDPYVSG